MRALLGGELTQAQSFSSDYYVKLEVQNGSGTWIDVGALLGKHWIVNAQWGESVDTTVSQATFALVQQIGTASLSPLMSASVLNVDDVGAYAPLLNVGRLVRASSATMAQGVALDVSKYREFFTGRIDSVQQADSGGGWAGPISIVCSDLGGWLMDMQIETSGIEYGTSPIGTALETVIQNILDTNIPAGEPAVTLYKQSSSAFAVTAWAQGETKVLDALSTIVLDSTGEDIRYRHDASHVSRLTWFNPDRSRVTIDATFTARQYVLRQLDLAIANIRNAGEMLYDDGAVTATSASSITSFRRRFFRLPASTMLTTSGEAQAVIDAVVNDLSFPPGEAAADMPFFWPVQLYDRYTFQSNARQYDADQTFGVMGYQHTIESGKGSTTLTLTARIVGAFNAWLHRIGTFALTPPALQPFTFIDTETMRIFSWTRNSATHSVWVYDNLIAVGGADPYDDPTSFPTVSPLLAGLDTYTVLKPVAGYQRAVHFVPRDIDGVAGNVRHEYIDPAPSGLSGTVKAAVTNGTADLTLHIAGVASNWPVAVDLFEDNPDGTAIYSTSVSAVTDILPASSAALTARALPLRELRRWYLRLTDVAGVKVWGIGSADRDALPNGSVTRTDLKSLPSFTSTYDDDTDSIRVTTPSGKTKTVSGLSGSGTWTYTVGDVLDDATMEAALAAGETRTPYIVEFHGGGVWVPFFNGPLHGTSLGTVYSQCTAAITAVTASTVSVTVTASSSIGAPTVHLVAITGSASLSSGPAVGATGNASGTVWVFNRGAFQAGLGQVQFRATFAGTQTDDDFVDIADVGRDTVALASRARVTATTATTVTVRYAVADPYPQGANSAAITYQDQGSGGVSPASGGTVTPAATLTEAAGTYIDYTITRPVSGAGPARVTFTTTAANRISDSDAVDLPEQAAAVVTAPTFTSVSYGGSPDYALNTIQVGWADANAPGGATYNVTVYEQTHPSHPERGNTYEFVGVASAMTYACINDIDAAGVLTKLFKAYVSMLNGSTVAAVSETVSLTLNSNT